MNRKPFQGTFFNCTLERVTNGGTPPADLKVFSDDKGAELMKCVNCTFQGQPFTK